MLGGLFNLNFVIFTGKQLANLFVIALCTIHHHICRPFTFSINLLLQSCSIFAPSLARKIKPILSLLRKKAVRKILLGQVQSLREYSNNNQVGQRRIFSLCNVSCRDTQPKSGHQCWGCAAQYHPVKFQDGAAVQMQYKKTYPRGPYDTKTVLSQVPSQIKI